MKQRIGNVGLLNLMNATAESIHNIERIGNVGMVVFRKETAHFLTELNIGNIGKSLEVPEGYKLSNGIINIDHAYLESLNEPQNLLVNGIVIIHHDVKLEDARWKKLNVIINGVIYAPPHLS